MDLLNRLVRIGEMPVELSIGIDFPEKIFYRKPISKKKRIIKKWRNRTANWKYKESATVGGEDGKQKL